MQKRKFLSPSEVRALLDAALDGPHPERNHCLIMMTWYHGLRASEALRLRLSDIDISGRTLFVRRLKNSFSTVQPVLPEESRALRAWLRVRKKWAEPDNDWLFISRAGRPLSRQQFGNILSALCEKTELSLSVHPHMLRHACGYALADNGADTRLIQDYLGHRNIRHTVRYTASNAARFEGIWRGKRLQRRQQNRPKCQPPADCTRYSIRLIPPYCRGNDVTI